MKQKKVEVKEEEKTEEDNAKPIITEEEQETGGIKFMSNEKCLRTLMLLGVAIPFLLFVVAAEAVNPMYTWLLGKISPQKAFTNITLGISNTLRKDRKERMEGHLRLVEAVSEDELIFRTEGGSGKTQRQGGGGQGVIGTY
ncbi:hypothetical protein BLNAU_20021 [Blattamonas nauphoetae]|uniref:Uncharacterized protein n=1 Tax=Blattamonas nauphoetae TaxID=2049346 RepID=A0ABQ9WZW0_9EUKA|nr:hypothetical protein BLNAU_20021 [Blattamonas nauphoetae]